MKALNRYRARRCARALRHYDTAFEVETCLVDFLADARHWCDRHGRSYAELDKLAYGHYRDEIAAARKAKP